jgi:hypothetical protein
VIEGGSLAGCVKNYFKRYQEPKPFKYTIKPRPAEVDKLFVALGEIVQSLDNDT